MKITCFTSFQIMTFDTSSSPLASVINAINFTDSSVGRIPEHATPTIVVSGEGNLESTPTPRDGSLSSFQRSDPVISFSFTRHNNCPKRTFSFMCSSIHNIFAII
ncbi:hypothetical protein BDR04DRAFT_491637 [Suillus decipiens]|nr:hypothetical protein BDR04DRAFT_491637 [Suillus decipiens]